MSKRIGFLIPAVLYFRSYRCTNSNRISDTVVSNIHAEQRSDNKSIVNIFMTFPWWRNICGTFRFYRRRSKLGHVKSQIVSGDVGNGVVNGQENNYLGGLKMPECLLV